MGGDTGGFWAEMIWIIYSSVINLIYPERKDENLMPVVLPFLIEVNITSTVFSAVTISSFRRAYRFLF